MPVELKKGSSLNLTKREPALKKVLVGFGWDVNKNQTLDLDVSVFMLGNHGKLIADEYLVFYNNLKSPDGAVQHTGDNHAGAGDDDEMILLNLPLITPLVQDLVFVVTIHEAIARKQSFGMLTNAYIRIVDMDTKKEILRYNLEMEFPQATDLEFCRIIKQGEDWLFQATGISNKIGLQGYVDKYL